MKHSPNYDAVIRSDCSWPFDPCRIKLKAGVSLSKHKLFIVIIIVHCLNGKQNKCNRQLHLLYIQYHCKVCVWVVEMFMLFYPTITLTSSILAETRYNEFFIPGLSLSHHTFMNFSNEHELCYMVGTKTLNSTGLNLRTGFCLLKNIGTMKTLCCFTVCYLLPNLLDVNNIQLT